MFAPYVYIELPLGSSRRELHFWEMGYWLLTYSGAITKNFIGLQAIFALQVRFLCLLPLYIFSSLLGAQGGGAPFFGKGFWAPSKSRSSHKKFQSSMIDIGSAVCILVLVFVWYYWCQLLPVFGLVGLEMSSKSYIVHTQGGQYTIHFQVGRIASRYHAATIL